MEVFNFEAETYLDLSASIACPIMRKQAQSNARFIGNVIEQILADAFGNLSLGPPNGAYDLISTCGKKIEVRTVTATTRISFEASENCGKGREGTGIEGTKAKIANMDGWIFACVKEFPLVKLVYFPGYSFKSLLLQKM